MDDPKLIKAAFDKLHAQMPTKLDWISYRDGNEIVFEKVQQPDRLQLELEHAKRTEKWFSDWAKDSIRRMERDEGFL